MDSEKAVDEQERTALLLSAQLVKAKSKLVGAEGYPQHSAVSLSIAGSRSLENLCPKL